MRDQIRLRGQWGALLLASLVGCETRQATTYEPLGHEQPNQCGGTVPRQQANLATVTALELGRWETTRDFQIADDATSLELSAEGAARCKAGCPAVLSVLGRQAHDGGLSDADAQAFGEALVQGFQRQLALDTGSSALPAYSLTRIGGQPSKCGQLYWFEADKADCSGGGDCGYDAPNSLSSKLAFAGYPDNPYLQFQSALDFQGQARSVVAVDPTGGLFDGDQYTGCAGGACLNGCVYVVQNPPPACDCCTCNAIFGLYRQSPTNRYEYLCCVPEAACVKISTTPLPQPCNLCLCGDWLGTWQQSPTNQYAYFCQ
jgi:hypothetical protein